MVEFYSGFEIDDQTGEPLTDKEMTAMHYKRIRALQVSKLSPTNNNIGKPLNT